ncbi:S-layer homology domain-containing protein [Thermosyntropha sp.]|uniref:S-layer homology domain-containing protein n=1 Tax=Thermosyntropha sp. TaxID=2740820 RepID=UPI0025DACA8A|nr:S-layer homology domain-containing protein [Thermosyntropha sp.]MBO8158494.1 S-layer homology domain-containing protein [Thermosyntropha sp.]
MSFSLSSANAAQYEDTKNHWAQYYIDYLNNAGYIRGYEDGTFRPDNNMTRAEFLSVLLNCIQRKPAYISYISGSSWAEVILDEAVKQGILNPSEYPTDINPYEFINRAEAAAFIARSLNIKPDYSPINFIKDIEQINSNPYKPYIKAIYKEGIITGYPSGEFKPYDKITRAQACVIFKRFLDKKIASYNNNPYSYPTIQKHYWENLTLSDVYAVYDKAGNKISSGSISRLRFRINNRSTLYDLDEIKVDPEYDYIIINNVKYDVSNIQILVRKNYSSYEYEYHLKDIYTKNNQLVFDCYQRSSIYIDKYYDICFYDTNYDRITSFDIYDLSVYLNGRWIKMTDSSLDILNEDEIEYKNKTYEITDLYLYCLYNNKQYKVYRTSYYGSKLKIYLETLSKSEYVAALDDIVFYEDGDRLNWYAEDLDIKINSRWHSFMDLSLISQDLIIYDDHRYMLKDKLIRKYNYPEIQYIINDAYFENERLIIKIERY